MRVAERVSDDRGPRAVGTGGDERRRVRTRVVVALVPCFAFWCVFIARSGTSRGGHRQFTLFGDAMISMRYAQTLASGHGLVWYPGAPRVEGYTNFLWTLVMAALLKLGLGVSGTSLAIMLLGIVILAATAVVAAVIVQQLGASQPWAPPLAVLAVGLCYPLVYWTLRGMEVGWLTLITMSACSLAFAIHATPTISTRARPVVALALLFGLGVLTRTEFAFVAIAIAAWIAVALRAGRGRAIAGSLIAVTALVAIGHSIFRWAYYGSIVPNTYTLKLTGLSLWTRYTTGLHASLAMILTAFVAPTILIAVTLVWVRSAVFTTRIALLVVVALTVGFYSTSVGGDAWEWMLIANRYVVPGLVATLVGAIACASRLVDRWPSASIRTRRSMIVVFAAFVVAAFLGPVANESLLGEGALEMRRVGPTLLAITFVLLGLGFAVSVWRRPTRAAGPILLAVFALAPIVGMGVRPGWAWVNHNAALVDYDNQMVAYGEQLRTVTRPGATIAVIGAGAPALYSRRATIDLLGKNDRRIARAEPRGTLPGHNKWSYRYSIGNLRPDVVAQLWVPIHDERMQDWGYVLVTPSRDPVPIDALATNEPLDQGAFWALDGSDRVRWDRVRTVRR